MLRAFGGVVAERAPAKAAAHVALGHLHLVGRDAERLRHLVAGGVCRLRALPDLGRLAVGRHAHHRVQRLHLRVIAVVAAILGAELLRRAGKGCVDVALLRQVGDLRLRIVMQFGVVLQRLGGIEACRRAVLPCRLDGVARRLGLLELLGDHRDAVRQPHGRDHARHLPDVGFVEALQRAGVHRRVHRGGIDHAGQLHVDAVDRRAVGLGRGVAPRHALADQPPVLAGFQFLGIDRGKRRGHLRKRGDLAIAQLLAVRRIDHEARLGFQRGDIHAPLLGRVLHQHLAHLRAGDPQIVEVEHRAAAADDGHHLVVLEGVAVQRRVAPGHLDRDLRPVGVHFLGDDHRQGRRGALAHFRAGADDSDRAVRRDPHPVVVLLAGSRRVGLRVANQLEAVGADREAERQAA